MNKDQAKGTAKKVIGTAQQKAGKLVGSTKQQAKGLAKRVAGTAQKAWGDARQSADRNERTRQRAARRQYR